MLNLLKYIDRLRTSEEKGVTYVYDFIRRKNLVLQAEEMVRQCVLHYLVDELGISKNFIKSEKGIKVNKLLRRCDIIAYTRNGDPILIVECKSPKVKLNQKVFNQIAMYNLPLQVPYLMVTNGKDNYFCKIDFDRERFEFLEELPSYDLMIENITFDKKKK